MRQGGFGGGPPGFGRGGSSGFGRGNSGGFGGRGMQRQDRIVGKSITIARGPYKYALPLMVGSKAKEAFFLEFKKVPLGLL